MTYNIDVYLRNTIDGFVNIHQPDYEYDDSEPFNSWIWWEGNFSCDCNRSLFLYEADLDDERELECNLGNNVIIIDKIVRRDTGEILYSESLVDGVFTKNIKDY
jgi:hypothetical protein